MPIPSASTFVPADLDPSDLQPLLSLHQALLDRPLASPAEVAAWLADYSDLSCVVAQYASLCSIDKACHTDDPQAEARYLHWVEKIQPALQPLHFELKKKYLATPHRSALTDPKLAILERDWGNEVELFRAENIPLQTQVAKLMSQYDRLAGAMLVNFRDQEHTLQQLARFSEDPDRATRAGAWRAAEERRAQDYAALDHLMAQLLDLRGTIAANSGCGDYRAYTWKSYSRCDYTPADCLHFGAAIAQVALPVVEELDLQRQRDLGVDTLRPWDLAVDPRQRPALSPFPPDRIDLFLERTAAALTAVSPDLGAQFRTLKLGRNLDLESRKAKRPGGFQSSLEVRREPFIFMNAAGLHRDVETMLHEAGHAFHYLDARDEPLLFVRSAPIEFCEVASMSMELLAGDHLGAFYAPDQQARAKRAHLEGIVRFFPWMAIIDGYQHWLYTHPGHSAAQRRAAWLDLHRRFASRHVDWSGLDEARAHYWQRQLHLYHYPFYYVEYGIAQLGALQVWRRFRQEPQATLADLRRAFALGGTRPLPDLFAAAGLRLDFSRATLEPLMAFVREELAALPA